MNKKAKKITEKYIINNDSILTTSIEDYAIKFTNWEDYRKDEQIPKWHKTTEGRPHPTTWDWKYYVAKLKPSDCDKDYAPKKYRVFAGSLEETATVMGIVETFVWTDSIYEYVNFDNIEAWLELPE